MDNAINLPDKWNIFVRRAIPAGSNEIKFDNNSLKLFMLIEGRENLIEIYKKANLDKESFVQAIKKLFLQGLIYKASDEQYISREKIEKIKSSLATHIGPLAQVIISDVMSSLGFTNERLPLPQARLFIERISDQIPIEKALEFKKSIEYDMTF